MDSSNAVTFVRIYLQEQDRALESLLRILHDERKVAGVTVFRGIAGYGESGEMHRASLLSLSLNLPLVVEFFDSTEHAMRAIESIQHLTHIQHIVSWPAQLHINNQQSKGTE